MELTHNNKTYKATEYWNNFVDSNIKYWILRGYLELVEETNLEECVPYKAMPSSYCTKTMKPLNECDCDLHWVKEKIELLPIYKPQPYD